MNALDPKRIDREPLEHKSGSSQQRSRRSMKSGLLQPFQHMVPRLVCAELTSERPGIEEGPHARGDGPLAVRILLSAQLGVRGRKHRMRDQLVTAPRTTRKGTVANIDAFGITAQKVVHHAEPCRCETIGRIKTERTLQPWQ